MGTRERIVEAARNVIHDKGLTRATTKEIAQAAGVSEGSLYNHFKNKSELFLHVIGELPANFIGRVEGLTGRTGQGTVRGNLEEVATAALTFYRESIPMGASFFAEPELLELHRKALKDQDAGPHKPNLAVADYLRAEQGLGRVPLNIDPEATAYLLLGACFQQAYWTLFSGAGASEKTARHFVDNVLNVLFQGIEPGES